MLMTAPPLQISLVYASTIGGGIGLKNALPWSMPADMKHFRALTLGKTVIMGSRTWNSIGRPLPKRVNIVLSRRCRPVDVDASVYWVGSVDEAIDVCQEQLIDKDVNDTSEMSGGGGEKVQEVRGVCVIGGGEVYRLMESMCMTVHHTLVKGEYICDTYYTLQGSDWEVAETRETDEADYRVLKRRPATKELKK